MTLIITHGDQDGAYCAGELGQIYPHASFFIPGRHKDMEIVIWHGENEFDYLLERTSPYIIDKIRRTRERELIVIADIIITNEIARAILEKLDKCKELIFMIFDHHVRPQLPDHKRIRVFYEDVSDAYRIIRKWKRSRRR